MRVLLLALLVAGCAARTDGPPAVEDRAASPFPGAPAEAPVARPAPPASDNVAVASLVTNARAESAAGRLANAGATLERALRLEPRNPRLWQELARVRLGQGEHAQAESLAARSSSWAGGDAAILADNWRIIADARLARGDSPGARAALENAARAAAR